MILRLADSRNRHIAEKEKLRASYERRFVQLQTRHTSDLRSLICSHEESAASIKEAIKVSHRDVEATRWLALDVEKLLKENRTSIEKLSTSQTPIASEVGAKELHTIQEDIAKLRLELGTLNMATYGNGQRTNDEADPTTTAALQDIKEEVAKLRREVGGATTTDGSQQPALPREAPCNHSTSFGESRKSYADTLSMPKHGLMLESVEPRHTSEDVLKLVKDSVDVIKMGIGINKVSKISRQRVIINCDTVKERDDLQYAIKNSTNKVTVSQARTRKPLLRLTGVTVDLSNQQIVEAVVAQNSTLLKDVADRDKMVRVVRRTKSRTPLLNNIIIETSSTLWQRLQDRRLRIGYQVVGAADQSPLVQCYNCLGFGHKAGDCKRPTKCGHCGDEHETRNCEARSCAPRCVNCQSQGRSEVGHPAYSSNCPEWIRWDRLARMAVAYC